MVKKPLGRNKLENVRSGLFFFVAVSLLFFSSSFMCQEKTVSKIVLEGADRITQEAFLALTSLRPGQVYDEENVKKEFKRIWDSGLFEDVSVDQEETAEGIQLTFKVKERPLISSVEYKGSKRLTQSTVLDKLKENKADVKTGTILDFGAIKKAESALRFMAAEKGYPDAVISSEIKNLGKSQVAVIFHLEDGPKARITKVAFLGAKAFSQRKLRDTFKKTRPHGWFSWANHHDIYSESRYQEDEKLLRELYEAQGYIDIEVGDPMVETKSSKNGKKKDIEITIPLKEGISYNLGKISLQGNKILSDAELLKGTRFEEGKTFNKLGFDAVLKIFEKKYGEKGYIYASATPVYDKNKETKVADVTVSFTENEQYFVNRIEFFGNTMTRDYVLRREMQVYEQELFNYRRYERGLYRVKMGGMFEIKEDPLITKVPDTNKVDIKITGTEANKNELLFGGGYGGVNGFYLTGQFRTYNFLGKGTTLSFNADVGKVQKLYSINYSDPWFFGKRIGFTSSIYNSELKYLQFDQLSRGGSVAVTWPLGDFAGFQTGYKFERSKVNNLESNVATTSNYYGLYNNDSVTSAVFTTLFWNSVNNPFRASRGWSAYLTTNFAGGPFGGDNYFIKPTFEGSLFLPSLKKQNSAFRLQLGYITPYNGHDIPLWERFFLGGEDSLRGFGVRSVYPLTKDERYFVDPNTGTIEGGNRYILTNLEYVFHITEQVDLAVFSDVGNTYHERQKWELSNYRADAGVEVRFFIPMFNVPLRLIWASNLKPKPGDDFSHFQFTIGLTF
jgi:outer membrane protein insertion porin family